MTVYCDTGVSTKTHDNLSVLNVGVVVKNDKGVIKFLMVSNLSATIRYFKLYNKGTTPLTTDIPVFVIPVEPNRTTQVNLSDGIYLANGISYRATGGLPDADDTPPLANEVVVNIGFN